MLRRQYFLFCIPLMLHSWNFPIPEYSFHLLYFRLYFHYYRFSMIYKSYNQKSDNSRYRSDKYSSHSKSFLFLAFFHTIIFFYNYRRFYLVLHIENNLNQIFISSDYYLTHHGPHLNYCHEHHSNLLNCHCL